MTPNWTWTLNNQKHSMYTKHLYQRPKFWSFRSTTSRFQIQSFQKSEMHWVTSDLLWTLNIKMSPVYTKYLPLRHIFCSVLLYDQPFSRYKFEENQNMISKMSLPNNGRLTLKHTVSHKYNTPLMYIPALLSCFLLCWTLFYSSNQQWASIRCPSVKPISQNPSSRLIAKLLERYLLTTPFFFFSKFCIFDFWWFCFVFVNMGLCGIKKT